MFKILESVGIVVLASAILIVCFILPCFFMWRFFYRWFKNFWLRFKPQPIDKDKAVKAVEKPTWFFSTMLKHFCKVPFFRRQFLERDLPISRYITKLFEQVATEVEQDQRSK